MSAIIAVGILALFFFFFLWGMLALGAKFDQNMEEALQKKYYFSNYNQLIILDTDTNPEPSKQPSETTEIVICPVCKHENRIPKGACSRCEVCFSKIGSCDE